MANIQQQAPCSCSGMNILMIDDNPIDIMMMEEGISSINDKTIFNSLQDGSLADKYIDESQLTNTDLILLDLNLPSVSGIELLEKVRSDQKNAKLPILIFSTSALDSDIEMALSKGANAYIIKPSGHEEFTDLAKRILSFWQSRHLAR